jgi:hypothetical protein
MKKKPARPAPTDAYYASIGLHALRVRVSKETLAQLDDLVPLTERKTKAQAVEEAIDLAWRAKVKKSPR